MKNLPYYKGGTCKIKEIHLSFKGNLAELEFTDFEDFCNRADRILQVYIENKSQISIRAYQNYIHTKTFTDNEKINEAIQDKCFEWIMSSEYEKISKNDLYSLLGLLRKEQK